MHTTNSRLPFRALAGLSITAVLALSTLPAANAAPVTTDQLSSVTNGAETPQVREMLPEQAALAPAKLPAAPDRTGKNPGATMGQSIKSMDNTSHLSEASLSDARQKVADAKNGKDVAVSGEEFAPALAQATATAQQGPVAGVASVAAATSPTGTGVLGMDVSGWQPSVDWAAEYAEGARFTYIKATEGNFYTSKAFSDQYVGATEVGMMRGAYHFAIPGDTSGETQARYFVANGGGWSPDGRTLPGLLDVEYNPYPELGDMCYGLTQTQMRDWIQDFVTTYDALTGRVPAIYSTTNWWQTCVGSTTQFNHLPLHIARYASTPGQMPFGWDTYDIWQYTDSGPFSGDSNVFNGTMSDLHSFATLASYQPMGNRTPTNAGFVDVDPSHPFYNEINWMAAQGISKGWPDGTYRPFEPIQRDAMAAFLYRLAGEPAYTPPAVSPFVDVPTDHIFYKEISWMASQGISKGWSDGTYRPNEPIKRDAMAAFLYRLAGEPQFQPTAASPFVDVTSSDIFYKEISWLAARGISTGWADGTYRPFNSTDRGQMAAFLYRYVTNG